MPSSYSRTESMPHGRPPAPKGSSWSSSWLLAIYAGLALAAFGAGFSISTSQLLGWTPISALLTLCAAAGGVLLLGILSEVR